LKVDINDDDDDDDGSNDDNDDIDPPRILGNLQSRYIMFIVQNSSRQNSNGCSTITKAQGHIPSKSGEIREGTHSFQQTMNTFIAGRKEFNIKYLSSPKAGNQK
jgi:hypothetical protein